MDSTKIIKKVLSYDNLIYLKIPEKIIKEYLVKFKKTNNIEENENSKIDIISLSKYMELDKIKIVKLLYFNIDSFYQILYDFDIEIILEEKETNLSYIFYAALLIKDNRNFVNFSFTIKLIQGIKNKIIENNKKNEKIYSNLILFKAIFDLIDAYKGLEDYNNNIKEIEEIEKNVTNIIEDLIQDINKNDKLKLNMNLAYIKSETIGQIYIYIIIGLLKNKSEDYNYIFSIIAEMELELINITKKMCKEIEKFLDDKKMIDKYLISSPEDLLNENKINFSYILLKYILKSSEFIYQINFFIEERKNFIKLCKSHCNIFSSNTDKKMIAKLNYMIEVFNLEYYINKYKDFNINENSNKSTEIGDTNNNNKNGDTNNKNKIEDTNKDNKIEYTNKNNNIKNTNSNNTKTGIKEKIISNTNQESEKNTQLTLMNSSAKNENTNKSESNKGKEGIKSAHYLTLTHKVDNIITQESINNKSTNNYKVTYKIIGEYINTEKNNYSTAEFITEIKDIFISFGTTNDIFIYNDSYEKISIIHTDDWIYNILYNNNKTNNKEASGFVASSKKNIYIFKEEKNKSIYKASDNPTEKNLIYLSSIENTYYFACCEDTVFLYNSMFEELQNKTKYSIYENKLMKSAIKIDHNFIAFKSNKIVSKGVSQILIYNYRNKKDIPDFIKKNKEDEEEYSFIFSPLGQALIIHKNYDNDAKTNIENRILLFACKKYFKNQKNGIYALYNMNDLLESQNDKSKFQEVDSYFHNTDNFEPYCICPLLIIKLKNILEASAEIKETNYFLVGGFVKKRKEGMIKLYKINYEIDDKKLTQLSKFSIEYIQDFKIFDENFEGFKGPISCITQSKKDGNLLITCWDGKIYFVKYTGFSFYFEQDEQIKKSANEFFSFEKADNQKI